MPDDTSIAEIPERVMVDQAISNSFKGILRISNVKDLETYYDGPTKTQIKDEFLVDTYYGDYKPTIDYDGNLVTWSPEGLQTTVEALTGDNARYVTDSEFTNLKIPVTDSLGHLLNFSLGAESASIGMNATLIDFTFDNTGITFPVLECDLVKAGLTERVIEQDKKAETGYITITGDAPALAIRNYYRHGSNDDQNKFTQSAYQLRTIINGSKEVHPYDAFIYKQEYYNTNTSRNNLPSTAASNIKKDCIVHIESLLNYVGNKIDRYIKYNTTQLPAGSIIWQYCSLNKWYCKIENTQNTTNDNSYWQGYRPALSSSAETNYFGSMNTNQGVFSSNLNPYIQYITENNIYATENIELAPEFKRNYVLCDGSSYSFNLIPDYLQTNTKEKNTFDLFLPLFFTIGYYYNDINNKILTFPHIWNSSSQRYMYDYSQPTNKYYRWTKTYYDGISNETLYGIHMATIAAFMKFNEAYNNADIFNSIKDSENKWDIEKSINWLKNQSINYEYIFNTVFSSDSITKAAKNGDSAKVKNIVYKCKPYSSDPSEVHVTVGREVNSFSDFIEYYESLPNNKANKTYCAIYKTAEIYDLARLFREKAECKYDNTSLNPDWLPYQFTFQVPKLYTEKDKLFNQANLSTVTGSNNTVTSVGLFVGSNGLLAANSIFKAGKGVLDKEGETIKNISDSYTYNSSSCTFTLGSTPHSHALAKGTSSLRECNHSLASNAKNNVTYFTSLTRTGISNNIIANKSQIDKNILAANFTWDTDNPKYIIHDEEGKVIALGPTSSKNTHPSIQNYFLQEVGANEGVTLKVKTNTMNGIAGLELTNDGYLWYGRTSEAIWDNTKIETNDSKYTEGGSNQGYFRPESIKMLPLIKL